jgi:bifunctional DNA-binding transcriptional regulator/antitoxin component of YhaV-PrlF toxin-antitoxin module
MQATLTSAALDFIPELIRQKFQLKAGTVLEFDEDAPYLKATPSFSVDDMMSCIGVAKGKYEGLSAIGYLEATRGKADA